MNRRQFLNSTAAGISLTSHTGFGRPVQNARRPMVIASSNGLKATEKAMQLIQQGVDTLDAVIAGVNLVEEDPNDRSVGYGGLPNEEGVVQLDSSVMHGPSRGAGAVAALEGFKYPSRVAKLVMERTDHVMLVGEGALKFALAMGFEKQDLLTPEAREIWLKWKRNLNSSDDWISPEDRLPQAMAAQKRRPLGKVLQHYGTINCNAINEHGEISGVTTTSGLSFKIPGRVGDSPIIGSGLYVDNEVGACGSTGRGEANMKTCASFMVVEFMRQGLSPEEAGLRVLKRIVENTVEPYLIDEKGRPRFDVKLYALNRTGEVSGTAIWSGSQYVLHTGETNEHYDVSYLFKREDSG